jgi:hypothetical protein
MNPSPREIIIVLGKTGYGKSRWTRQFLDGCRRVFMYDPIHEADAEWHDNVSIVERFDNGTFRQGNDFYVATSEESAIDTFGSIAFLVGDCVYAVEEASLVFEKGMRLQGWAKNIVFLGRHRNCSLLVTAQRAASIPIELRSQATRVVSFAQHESDDLLWLKAFLGKTIVELPHLPRLTCYDSNEGVIKKYTIL